MLNEKSVTRITALAKAVKPFFPLTQLQVVLGYIFAFEDEGWEANYHHYIGVLNKFKKTFDSMPKTYETEHIKTNEQIVHLHYFIGSCDWWIIEKDQLEEQQQAFGVVDLGQGPELGYISILELTTLKIGTAFGFSLPVELDLHWEPTKIKDIPALQGKFSTKE